MSDLLDDLVKASRDVPVQHDEADETRRRILAAANHQARTTSRRRLAPWVLPLVAALVATGALAAGPLGVTQAIFGPAPTAPAVTVPPALPAKTGPARPHAAEASTDASPVVPPVGDPPVPSVTAIAIPSDPAPAPAPPPVAEAPKELALKLPSPPHVGSTPAAGRPGSILGVEARKEEPVEPREPRALPAEPVGGIVVTPPPVPPPTSPVPPPADPSDDLYRTAHDTHFRGGNPSAAIEAWDRYLSAAPRGRFAVEARYNRALALLKAGRRSEGLAALEPFASGAFGNYRRDEAQRLLGAARDGGAP